jgi:hypothetical protein
MLNDIPSPCIGLCQLDKEKHFCIGCFRTIQEIARWQELKPDVKRAIVAALPYRQQLYEHSD